MPDQKISKLYSGWIPTEGFSSGVLFIRENCSGAGYVNYANITWRYKIHDIIVSSGQVITVGHGALESNVTVVVSPILGEYIWFNFTVVSWYSGAYQDFSITFRAYLYLSDS
ncbi:hypothetical protein DRO54_11690 [Candidatus Bathyarchaeota archaeon]|nr:MAG: hypothetical protein DRO54_11690 [Candidatus Bathyarchaeota archaeon]